MDEKKKKLAFAITEFLGSTRDQLIDDEKKESVNGARSFKRDGVASPLV